MQSFTCPRFWSGFEQLPKQVRERTRQAYAYFIKDPNHPRLHFKPIWKPIGLYSVRADENYRALGAVSGGNEIMWFWIGPHDEYLRKIKSPKKIKRSVEMARKNLADRRSKQ